MDETENNSITPSGDFSVSANTDNFLEETLEKIQPVNVKVTQYTPPTPPTPPETLPVSEQVSVVVSGPGQPITPKPATQTTTPQAPQETVEPEPEYEKVALSRTYENDLSNAMSVTDAKVVQTMLRDARNREELENIIKKEKRARKWYVAGSIFLFIATLAAIGYSVYHYQKLTVPVVEYVSVGVFPTTPITSIQETTISTVLQNLNPDDFPEGRPYLIDLVNNNETRELLTNTQLFNFIEAPVNEPFTATFSVVRMGVMKKEGALIPFIIGSTENPENTLRELSIAEPSLIAYFERSLPVQTDLIAPDSLSTFTSEYRFNIALRSLYTTTLEGIRRLTIFYGLINDQTAIIATEPEIVRAVYETLIKQ